MPKDYTIVHLSDEHSKEDYPVLMEKNKYKRLCKNVDHTNAGVSEIKLAKHERMETSKLYQGHKKTIFKFDEEKEKDPVARTFNKAMDGGKIVMYNTEMVKGGRLFLGGAIGKDTRVFNAIPYPEEEEDEGEEDNNNEEVNDAEDSESSEKNDQ